MGYEKFIEEYLKNGLLKKQQSSLLAVEKLINRSAKELNAAKANLTIDEGIAYTVAYLGMLHAGRAFMLLKGFRPNDGYQHKTVVEFMAHALGAEYKNIIERFDRMRRKRGIRWPAHGTGIWRDAFSWGKSRQRFNQETLDYN